MTALPALLAALTALSSTNAYTFASPAVGTAIRGVVMSDSGDYGGMRYEDIAWLTEAAAERDWLFGRPDATEADFFRATSPSNAVLPSVRIARYELPLPAAKALKNVGEISDEPRLIHIGTNWTQAVMRPTTNDYAHAPTYIIQSMTNGTTDVWTNVWSSTFRSNTLYRTTVTNAAALADFCMTTGVVSMADDGPFKLQGPYSKTVLTNLYATIRRMRHSVPMPSQYDQSSLSNGVERFYYDNQDGNKTVTTNRTSGYFYKVKASHEQTYRDDQYLDGGTWRSNPSYPRTSWAKLNIADRLSGETFGVPSMTLNLAVYTNSASPRITKALSFASALISRHVQRESYHTTATGTQNDENTYLDEQAQVMIPLGEATARRGNGPWLEFGVPANFDAVGHAVSLCDWQLPTDSYIPNLPDVGTPSYRNTDSTHRQKLAYQYALEELTVTVSDVLFIIIVNPSTKLSTWSEYD